MYRRNKFIVHSSLFIGLWSMAFGLWSVSYAEEFKAKEPIVVNGDRVEYFQERKEVVGSGNVSITYKDVLLTCDKITVYLDTREGIAKGNVRITQKDAYFTGDKINYNFDTRAGRVIDGYVNAKPFYGRSKEIDKVGDNQVDIKRGYVTTCDLDEPHYRIQAKQVKIYLEDKVVAKHILVFVGKVPIFYFPYYVQPLKDETAHITVQAGQRTEWGYYALSSLKYYFSDICKGRFLVDYRSKKGLAAGIDNYYTTKELGSGSARFYFANENDSTAYMPEGENEFKYRVQVRHKWDMGHDTLATFEFNKLRDQNFIKDYFYNEFEEEGQVDNYLSFVTTKRDYSTILLLRKRMDKYFNIVERLPEFILTIPNTRISEKYPVYYKQDASAVYLNRTFPSADITPKDLNTIRVDTYNQISYAARLMHFLSVTPFVGTRQTFYSRNKWGDTNLVRGVLQAGFDASTKFYRIYDVETDFLGLDIHKLRHIITPTASYHYTHQPTISPDELNQYDSIDAIDAANGIVLALENKLQTKRFDGGQLKSVDLATFIVSTDYEFRLKKNDLAYKSQKFQSVDFQLEVVPYGWLYSLANMKVNTKKSLVESASIDLVANRGEDMFFGMGYRYEDVESGRSNLVTMDATYRVSKNWKIRAYERFNLANGSFDEQEYTIYRDLHCWIAEFTYDIKTYTKEQTFWLVFRLKAFPDLPIGLRRTYYRPQFGTIGR